MVDRLRDRLVKERITLHVLIVRGLECPRLREALQKVPGCTIVETDPVNLLSRLEDACAALTCVYELRYRLLEAPLEGEITVTCPTGTGSVRIPSYTEV